MGLESVQQNIVPATNQVQPPNNSVASLLAGVQNQSPPDPIRETQEATIKFLQKDNRSLRNKMNRIFKKNEIENLEPDTDEGDGADDGEEGEMVTSENLDVEILKKFGAKIANWSLQIQYFDNFSTSFLPHTIQKSFLHTGHCIAVGNSLSVIS